MALKDHPVFFVCAACAATAAATWTASEQLRVSPMKLKLEVQEATHRSSPLIRNITVTKTATANGQIADQNIEFSDPDGDAVFINYVLLGTNAKDVSVSSTTIKVAKEQQIQGATVVGKWTCGNDAYFVKLRAIITDAGGRTSLPYDYTINCNL